MQVRYQAALQSDIFRADIFGDGPFLGPADYRVRPLATQPCLGRRSGVAAFAVRHRFLVDKKPPDRDTVVQ